MDPNLDNYLARSGAARGRPFDRRLDIRPGLGATADTIDQMARVACQGGRDLVVRLVALDIIDGIPGRDHGSIARRIFHWMQDRGRDYRTGVKFVNDPYGVETIQAPWITLCVTGAGDCNSAHSTTNAALLLSLGVPCFFRTVKVDPNRKNLFTHVYCVARIRPYRDQPGYELAMDTSVPFSKPGFEPNVIYGKQDWPIPIVTEDDWRSPRPQLINRPFDEEEE